MKTGGVILLSAVVAAAVSLVVVKTATPGEAVHKETAYERMIRTGTLRCGYEYWEGGVSRDPKTNELYGPWVDIMNEIGRAAEIKIEWTEHVGWGDVGAALKSGKIDADCAGMWQSTAKAKEIAFSLPLAYQGMEIFVAGKEHRFDDHPELIDDPSTRIAVIEADNSDFLTQTDYPKAQRLSLGQLTGTDSDLLMDLATGKADVTFTMPTFWRIFDKSNPGKVRRLMPGHNLRLFGLSLAVDNEDPRLLEMLNIGVQEILNSGAAGRIIDKANVDYPDMYLKVAKPYTP